MPKKTKKEKIKRSATVTRVGIEQQDSLKHHEAQHDHTHDHSHDHSHDHTHTHAETFSFRSATVHKVATNRATSDTALYPYLKKDLLKTVVLAAIAFSVLFILSSLIR